jgi:hypothetical protein
MELMPPVQWLSASGWQLLHRVLASDRSDTAFGLNVSMPKSLEMFVGQSFDRVITLCDRVRERCAIWPDSPPIHWSLPVLAQFFISEAESHLMWFSSHDHEIRAKMQEFLQS